MESTYLTIEFLADRRRIVFSTNRDITSRRSPTGELVSERELTREVDHALIKLFSLLEMAVEDTPNTVLRLARLNAKLDELIATEGDIVIHVRHQ